MNINSDINILGGLPDFDLISHFWHSKNDNIEDVTIYRTFTKVKTEKSVQRFKKAISSSFLRFNPPKLEYLFASMVIEEKISNDTLFFLFWNASNNNELLNFINEKVYFPAFFSGRLVIKNEDVSACIKELKENNKVVQNWTNLTIETVSRKYLILLKKFNLMTGHLNKQIVHPFLSDKMFVLFVYFIAAVQENSNLFGSYWLKYSFCERSVFIERLMQKKFAKYFQINYTGDRLKIETTVSHEEIYHVIK